MQTKKILFGIVTYNEKFWQCDTFLSLVTSYELSNNEYSNLIVYIFDNTENPNWEKLSFDIDGVEIIYKNDRKNHGISIAYNKIFEYSYEENFEWIVFLDQDTKLPNNFYDVYFEKTLQQKSSSNPIAVPLVYSNEKLISPSRFKNHRSYSLKEINSKLLDLKLITCINTGLLIKTSFYKEVGGYNENIKLDFCDHDFIHRVKKKTSKIEILDLKLKQDFSSETDSLEKAIFRYSIFVKDIKAYTFDKNKIAVFLLVDLPHLLKLTYKYKSFRFLKIRTKA